MQVKPASQVVPLQQIWFIPPHRQKEPKPVAVQISRPVQVLPAQQGVFLVPQARQRLTPETGKQRLDALQALLAQQR